MPESTKLDAEARLSADQDGTYKAQLLETLEKHRDDIAFQQQGFLPPDEYEVVEYMAKAVDAALAVIGAYEVPTDGNNSTDIASAPMIHI